MPRYSSPDHPLPSSWWGELKRLLRLRARARAEQSPEGLGALFVRKREVRPDEITTCYVRSMDHLPHVADRLKSARPVLVNLEEMEPEELPRALDFLSGVAYALDGCYDTVGENVFLLVPGSVTIIDEE